LFETILNKSLRFYGIQSRSMLARALNLQHVRFLQGESVQWHWLDYTLLASNVGRWAVSKHEQSLCCGQVLRSSVFLLGWTSRYSCEVIRQQLFITEVTCCWCYFAKDANLPL